jgi:hypothetical protein
LEQGVTCAVQNPAALKRYVHMANASSRISALPDAVEVAGFF